MLPTDTVVEEVVAEFRDRSTTGIAKYGVTLDRRDIDLVDWLQHLKEELMDAVNYVHRSQRDLRAARPGAVPVHEARDLLARDRDLYKPLTFVAQREDEWVLRANHGPAYVPSHPKSIDHAWDVA